MPEKILLLGHERDRGLELARALIALGFHPVAEDWGDFVPRRRRNRPEAIVADMDNPRASPLAEFVPRVKKFWGEAFPVVAMAESRKFQVSSAFIEDGADDYLCKGAPAGLVEKKIRRCLEKASRHPPSDLYEEVPADLLRLFQDNSRLTTLGEIAAIHAGAAPRRSWCRRMAPPDAGWRGVLTASQLDRFHVGRPGEYLLWSRLHLFRAPAPEEYSVPEKVLLCRNGPPLRAAVDKSRLPAGADVYSLVPLEGTGAGWLACVLNSRLMDFYFNRLAKNDDGRLRPDVLRRAPVPVPTPAGVSELGRVATLLSHFGPSPQSWIDRQSKEEQWERMEEMVFDLFGAGSSARAGLAAMHF
jgi:CheY-like chemotaxis protein